MLGVLEGTVSVSLFLFSVTNERVEVKVAAQSIKMS